MIDFKLERQAVGAGRHRSAYGSDFKELEKQAEEADEGAGSLRDEAIHLERKAQKLRHAAETARRQLLDSDALVEFLDEARAGDLLFCDALVIERAMDGEFDSRELLGIGLRYGLRIPADLFPERRAK